MKPMALAAIWLSFLAGAGTGGEEPSSLSGLAHAGFRAMLADDPAGAAESFARLLEQDPTRWEFCLYLGEALSTMNRRQQAAQIYWQGLVYRPDDTELLFGVALTQEANQDKAGAMETLERILDIDPYHARATHLLGVLRVDVGEHEAAVELLRRVIQWQPGNQGAWFHLGRAFVAWKRPADAIPPLERSIELEPHHPDSYFQMSRARQLMGQTQEARQLLELFQKKSLQGQQDEELTRAAQHEPSNLERWLRLAQHYFSTERPRDAIYPLQRAIQVAPADARPHHLMGLAYLQIGRTNEAKTFLIAAIRRDPTVGAYYHALGMVSLAEGQPLLAAEAFRQAIRVGGDVPEFHRSLAQVLEAMGSKQEAATHYEKYRSLAETSDSSK